MLKTHKFKVTIDNYSIEQVEQFRYLGVILDNKLNWNAHINYVALKLAQCAGVIYKSRKKVPQKVLLLIYNSLGAHYLRYGVACWGAARDTALTRLKNLQKKIIRYITNSPQDTNVDDKFRELGVLTLDEIYFQEVAKFMYRNSNKTLPASFDEYFKPIDHTHYTRTKSQNVYSLPRPRTDFGKQSIKYNGIKIWSQVPCGIKSITNKDSFNFQIKTFLLVRS